MAEVKIHGEGAAEITRSEDGSVNVKSNQPLTAAPDLPITDIRVNVLELVSASIVKTSNGRAFRFEYADGGTVSIDIDFETGKFTSTGEGVLSSFTDGDDRSHTVLAYLPKKRAISKKTH